jgi:hypothetical protein
MAGLVFGIHVSQVHWCPEAEIESWRTIKPTDIHLEFCTKTVQFMTGGQGLAFVMYISWCKAKSQL